MPRTQTFVPEPAIDRSFRVLNSRLLTPDGRSSSIYIDRSALRELEWHIGEGVKVANGRGVEVGGLVLGPTLDWNAAEVVISGFVPVQSEYRFGPDFRPSDIDIAAFKEAVAGFEGTVIGYFRSQLRKDATLRAEDARLLAELFPESDCCFIPIHAGKNTASTAGLYRVRLGAEPELLDLFALNDRGYGLLEAEAIAEPSVPLIEGQFSPPEEPQHAKTRPISNDIPASFIESRLTEWDEKPKKKRYLWLLLAFAAALLTFATAFILGHSASGRGRNEVESGTVSKTLDDPKIGLTMTERESEVEIRWNSASAALATAVRGRLIITDHPARSIDLELSQVRSGLYLYKPSSRSLSVLLMINQKDGSFAGQTATLLAKHIALEPPPTFGGLNQSEKAGKHRAAEARVPNRIAKWSSVAAPSIAQRAKVISSAPVTAFVLPRNLQTAKTAPLPAILQPPPSIVTATAASGVSVNLASQLVPVPPAAAVPLVPAPPVISQRVSPSYPTRLLAPRLVHQAVPAVPLGVAPRIRAEVRLEVSVSVDADGKATGAHIVSSEGTAAGLLAIEVLKAAQLSRFLPAQQDGKAVPGTVVLTFRFAPSRG